MARCYQCGIETQARWEGSPTCNDCRSKLAGRTEELNAAELNARLANARENYRLAVQAQNEAIAWKPTFAGGSRPRTEAIEKANQGVEFAALRFREALRDFVTHVKKNLET